MDDDVVAVTLQGLFQFVVGLEVVAPNLQMLSLIVLHAEQALAMKNYARAHLSNVNHSYHAPHNKRHITLDP